MSAILFDLDEIHGSLKAFQVAFPGINDTLDMRREEVTDDMVGKIVQAYGFLNQQLSKGIDLFTPAGLHSLLEMNHIVLCGVDPDLRLEYYQHLMETRTRFLRGIKPIKEWVLAKRKSEGPWKLAAGFYAKSLSQPQLFLEGNHRTGNILLNYLLVSRGESPYVVSPETARDYLNISGDIKFTDKDKSLDNALRMPGHLKRFRTFLKEHVDSRWLAG